MNKELPIQFSFSAFSKCKTTSETFKKDNDLCYGDEVINISHGCQMRVIRNLHK